MERRNRRSLLQDRKRVASQILHKRRRNYSINKKTNEHRIHPTQKPIDLYRWIAREYIKPGWNVLDTHTGSASSLIAYHEAGIRYVGFEINEKMYQKARKRLKEVENQLSIFDLGVKR